MRKAKKTKALTHKKRKNPSSSKKHSHSKQKSQSKKKQSKSTNTIGNFNNNLKSSLQSLKQNKILLLFSIFFDAVFFVAFGTLFVTIYERLIIHVLAVYEYLNQGVAAIGDAVTEVGADASDIFVPEVGLDPSFYQHYEMIIYYTFIFLVGFALIWCVLQGINWFITQKIVLKTKTHPSYLSSNPFINSFSLASIKEFFLYLLSFACYTFLFVIITGIITFLSIKLSSASAKSVLPILTDGIVQYGLLFIYLAMSYFLFTTYTLINQKPFLKLPKYTWKEAKNLQPALSFLFSLLLILLTNYLFFRILIASFDHAFLLSTLFALFFLLPSYTLGRVFIATAIKE